MKTALIFLLPLIALQCTKHGNNAAKIAPVAEDIVVGGGCDGCEIMYIGMPKNITAIDTSAGWDEKGQKLVVKGTVFKYDGKTPASNIIIYYWQTDNNGLYSPAPGMDSKSARHGHIRGWIKTGADGRFALFTIRPASYPNSNNPQHIHTTVKEPGLSEYYIDEWVFDDDPLLTPTQRKQAQQRGGNGILKINSADGLQVAQQNIYLGKNIPDYPSADKQTGH